MNYPDTDREWFLKLKQEYPRTMKDFSFEEYYEYEINRIQSQLEDGYLDISDSCGDELVFKIISEAFELYKDKYNMK